MKSVPMSHNCEGDPRFVDQNYGFFSDPLQPKRQRGSGQDAKSTQKKKLSTPYDEPI